MHVNLIPINKIENGAYDQSSIESIMKFRDYLNSKGITATIRRELGSDIEAACGQLRRKKFKNWRSKLKKKNNQKKIKKQCENCIKKFRLIIR